MLLYLDTMVPTSSVTCCRVVDRKIYSKLLEWKKETKGTKSLLIEWARRIGKSTVATEFGRKEYKSYIMIDFIKGTL